MIPSMKNKYFSGLVKAFLFATLTFISGVAHGAFIDDQRAVFTAIKAKVEAVGPKIIADASDDSKLAQYRIELDKLAKDVLDVAVAFRPRLSEINKRLTDIGPAPAADALAETTAVSDERKRLGAEKAAINALLGETEDVSIAANQQVDDIAERRRNLFAEDLTKRVDIKTVLGSEVGSAAQSEAATLVKMLNSWFTFVTNFKLQSVLGATFFALLSAIIMFMGGNRLFGRFYSRDARSEEPSYLSRLSVAFWSTLIPTTTVVIFLAVTYFFFDYFKVLRPDIREIFVSALSTSAIVYFIYRLASAILSPDMPNWRLLPVDPKPARLLVWLVTATAVVSGLDTFTNVINEALGSPLSLTIAKSLVGTVLVGLLVIAISFVKPTQKSRVASISAFNLRNGLFVLGLLPLIAALLGYVGLARFVSQQIVITGAILITMYLGFKSAQSLSSEGAFAVSSIGKSAQRRFALEDLGVDRLGVLASIVVNLLVLIIGIPLILLQWRFQWDDIRSWIYKALNGFTIGSVTISLIGVLTGIVMFALIWALTRWFQRWLDSNVLSRGKIDSGVRHSIRTAIGYAGIALALLIGISSAGIDLTSLALVAGALSLGIGFGLQNIVSNFVSGLILLAERPFKVGDWIEAGSTAGIVKKISVRATEVETFHRQTVILPNSELINAAVGNWTHRNKLGRIDIPVSVTYGSDVRLVQAALLDIGRGNPMVLKSPEPFVLFAGFGRAALDFELRVHLGDITQSPIVQNAIRFAIMEKFKELGIDIPVPPRDIAIRGLAGDSISLTGTVLTSAPSVEKAKIVRKSRAKSIKT